MNLSAGPAWRPVGNSDGETWSTSAMRNTIVCESCVESASREEVRSSMRLIQGGAG